MYHTVRGSALPLLCTYKCTRVRNTKSGSSARRPQVSNVRSLRSRLWAAGRRAPLPAARRLPCAIVVQAM
jgi:hypothetical protein